jgi:serine/threonine protein kinase/WD40 repeat protein
MADILACPELHQLTKIALGEFPEEKAAAMIEHLANCSNCATRLSSIVAEDSLVDAVRSKDAAPAQPELDAVQRLLERVRGLVAETKGVQADQTRDLPAPVSNEDTPNFSWVDSSDQPVKEDDGLAPPKGPGEIGWLGPYRVLKVLGEGGMGKVFLAEDPALQRSVALKVMKPSLARNKNSRQRFLQEARAAAAIEHDNIIHIYQVSEDRGVPFVAMPLLKGASLDDVLRRAGALQLKQTLRIGTQIAEGLTAAHERKLIHRDIKPGNIWIEPTGGGRVKILDFGLARTTEGETGLTQSGAILGTPAYMPPEQARGEKVDHRADLYSLGCVLYRMATGEMPLKGNDTMGMLMALAMQEPTVAKLVKPDMPQALSDLIMKLLAKDPSKRFASAREVVVALKAVESGAAAPAKSETAILSQSMLQPPAELPMAIPMEPSKTESPFINLKTNPEMRPAEKVKSETPANDRAIPAPARKKPLMRVLVACGLAAAFFFVLLGGGLAYQFLFRTSDGTLIVDIADDLEAKFKKGELVISDAKGNKLYSLKLSDKNKKLPPGEYLIEVTGADGLKLDTKKFEIVKNGERKVMVTLVPPTAIAQNANPLPGKGSTVVPTDFATLDKLDPAAIPAAERFDWQPKNLVASIGEHRGRYWGNFSGLSFSPDSKSIIVTGHPMINMPLVFDAETLREKAYIKDARIMTAIFSPDGKTLITSEYGTDDGLLLALRDYMGSDSKKRLQIATKGQYPSLSKDGKTLGTSFFDPVQIFDLSGAKPRLRCEIKSILTNRCYVAPDGKSVVISDDKTLHLWDISTDEPKERAVLPLGHRVAYSDDGKILATQSLPTGLQFWDLTTPEPKKRAFLKDVPVDSMAFSPDGKSLAWCGLGHFAGLHIVDLTGPEPVQTFHTARNEGGIVAYSPDGKSLAVASGNQLRVWDMTGAEPQERFPPTGQQLNGAIFSPDGKTAATIINQDNRIKLWDMTGAEPRPRGELLGHKGWVSGVSFAPDSKTVASSSGDGTVRLWDLTSAEPEEKIMIRPGTSSVQGVRFNPDGKSILCYCEPGIRMWDISGPEPTERWMFPTQSVALSLSPDGNMLASSRLEKEQQVIAIVDVSGEKPNERWILKTPPNLYTYYGSHATAWSPDGKSLAVHCAAGHIHSAAQFWDLSGPTPKERGYLEQRGDTITSAFSPDGKLFAWVSTIDGVILWDTKKKARLQSWKAPGVINDITFAPDGRHLITANANGTVYVLRLDPPAGAKAEKAIQK